MTALRLPRLPIWILAVWLVALAGEIGAHLAHHLLDGAGGAGCGFFAAADHAPGHLEAPPVLPGPRRAPERLPRLASVAPASPVSLAPSTRAPPATPPTTSA